MQTSAIRAPRDHQVEALSALDSALQGHDRAQLVMACGTGKTLVGRWYAERVGAAVSVVVVPSLSLVAQTVREWRSGGGWP
ncbi:DEAD/DEAH box helicase family protein, partial [Mycobacterium avium]|nr:DEAD/DEAH box helicase family protein [Mycobacterium avium]